VRLGILSEDPPEVIAVEVSDLPAGK